MTLPRLVTFTACATLAVGAGLAQTAAPPSPAASQSTEAKADQKPAGQRPAGAAAKPPGPPPQFAIGPVQFSGLVDGYYDVNFNHPASGNNQLRNFDMKANQFSLNMAKVVMGILPIRSGFASIS